MNDIEINVVFVGQPMEERRTEGFSDPQSDSLYGRNLFRLDVSLRGLGTGGFTEGILQERHRTHGYPHGRLKCRNLCA